MDKEILNYKNALNRLSNNEELYQEICLEFKASSFSYLKEIEVNHKKDMPKTIRSLHLLTGISRNVGAEKLASISGNLELELRENKTMSPFQFSNLSSLVEKTYKEVEQLDRLHLS